MKLMLKCSVVAAICVLFVLELIAAGTTLTKNDLEYYKSQNATFSKDLESYFDNEKPAYDSIERRNALYLVDALTHYPGPHDECIKEMFLNRYTKALNGIRETEVKTGVVVWNVYNMAFIVKTREVTVAFDLTRLPVCLRKAGQEGRYNKLAKEMVGLCDILFVSHRHGDHADPFVAKEFLKLKKPVIANSDVFKEETFYQEIVHWPADGKGKKLLIPTAAVEILLRVYPGHQAISAEAALDNNFTVVTFPNNITVAHSGDQSWNDDFKWIDTVHKDVEIDILLVNTWTLGPDKMIEGLRPRFIIPGHISEMEHELISRIAFWRSYQSWQKGGDKVIHLFWGEPYKFSRIIIINNN